MPADTIRIGIAAAGPRFSDPNLTTQGADNWATEQLYEQLVRPEDGQFGVTPKDFKPTLARAGRYQPTRRTWTFKLRQGVQFHKGYGEMTSEDVVFSFERAHQGGTRKSLSNVASVAAEGPYGFVLNLHNPDPLVLGNLDLQQQRQHRQQEGRPTDGRGLPDRCGRHRALPAHPLRSEGGVTSSFSGLLGPEGQDEMSRCSTSPIPRRERWRFWRGRST